MTQEKLVIDGLDKQLNEEMLVEIEKEVYSILFSEMNTENIEISWEYQENWDR